MKRAWEWCPEICISAPLPSNQHYDLRQVSSHLGTQSPKGDTKEFGPFGLSGPSQECPQFCVAELHGLWAPPPADRHWTQK